MSDEAIELAAMGRLHDVAPREHLKACLECATEVEAHREWIATLNFALIELLSPSDVLTLKMNGHGPA